MTASAPKKRAPAQEQERLSAAECASRTGLTVRALRVYERQGLIKPERSANGWRRYGPAELAKLNTIVILKALGLTLSQIRAVLAANPPSMLRILDIHARSWQAKLDMAQRALTLVEAARERLRAQESLSLDELCELIKRLEANRSVAMKDAAVVTRELINEMITPEEERAWLTWWAQHPEDKAQLDAFLAEQNALMTRVRQLMADRESPASPAVQALLRRHCELMLLHNVRERTRRLRAWDATTTEKWTSLGARLRRIRDGGDELTEFWGEAMRQSPWGLALRQLMLEVREIMRAESDPAAAAFDEPIRRAREICAEHALGDLLLLIEFRRFMFPFYGSQPQFAAPEGSLQAEWEFMERALRAREPTAPRAA